MSLKDIWDTAIDAAGRIVDFKVDKEINRYSNHGGSHDAHYQSYLARNAWDEPNYDEPVAGNYFQKVTSTPMGAAGVAVAGLLLALVIAKSTRLI